MLPELQQEVSSPRVSDSIGNGFILLGAREEYARKIPDIESAALQEYYLKKDIDLGTGTLYIQKWARLRLPNLQIVRSAWKEKIKELNRVRMARNIMLLKIYLL